MRAGGFAHPAAIAVAAAAIALSGCVGSPTYGTDKPADQQLLEDLTGVLSLAPKDKENIEYKPRPELVKPASTAALPAPQDGIVTASNPAWPESPEQRRARIRSEATINSEAYNFDPEVTDDVAAVNSGRMPLRHTKGDPVDINGNPLVDINRGGRDEFNRRLAERNQGNPTNRKYLSEPPLDYRVPAASAPTDDIGEDEWKKKKRRENNAKEGWGWEDILPW